MSTALSIRILIAAALSLACLSPTRADSYSDALKAAGIESDLAGLKKYLKQFQPTPAAKSGAAPAVVPPRSAKELEPAVRRIIRDLDGQGRWVTTYADEKLVGQPKFERGFRYISSEMFRRNAEVLSAYLASGAK